MDVGYSETTVHFGLPFAADVHSGRLEPKIGTAMAYMGTALLKAIETAEMEGRIEALERSGIGRPYRSLGAQRNWKTASKPWDAAELEDRIEALERLNKLT